jgi:hypothetical protein
VVVGALDPASGSTVTATAPVVSTSTGPSMLCMTQPTRVGEIQGSVDRADRHRELVRRIRIVEQQQRRVRRARRRPRMCAPVVRPPPVLVRQLDLTIGCPAEHRQTRIEHPLRAGRLRNRRRAESSHNVGLYFSSSWRQLSRDLRGQFCASNSAADLTPSAAEPVRFLLSSNR